MIVLLLLTAGPFAKLVVQLINAFSTAYWTLPVLLFSNENQEPAHIHVKAGEDEAKFWLQPANLAANHGFRVRDLNELDRLVRENERVFVEAWNEYFDDQF